MTPDEIRAKQRELESQKRALEIELAKLAEAQKTAELEPLKVTFTHLDGDLLTFELNRYDEPTVAIFRSFPSRVYRGEKKNTIDYRQYDSLCERLKSAGIEIDHNPIVILAKIKERLARADYEISFSGRGNHLVVKLNNSQLNSSPFTRIPGHRWDSANYSWLIPAHEGWRVFELLKDKNAQWDDEALNIVKSDVEKRAKLDNIAKLEDVDLGIEPLNGLFLYPFQRVGVEFIKHAGYRAIVADQPGLGKTPEFIAAVKVLERELGRPVRAAVFCPAALKTNWRVQIKKFTWESAKLFYGSDPRPSDILSLLGESKPKWAIFNYDILGKRLEYSNEYEGKDGAKIKGDVTIRYPWVELINASHFDIIGIDEAHYIKNIDSNRSKAVRTLQCERIVFLTATPVMNRPRELWPLLNILVPELFPSYETFLGTYEYDGRARNSAELLELLKPLMIRRLKKDVVKDLPPINRIYEFYELSEKAQKIYNRIMDGIFERVAELGGGDGHEEQVTSILTQIMRLKQVCAIDKMDKIAELATDLFDARENGEASKVLIFSQFVPVARGIARRLGQEAIIVTGETPQEKRDELVYDFQTDDNVHFLVATKGVLSEGKDLTKAGHVIFADLFWTPAAHEQAEGRAYGRLSELHSINSYYCTAKQIDGEESIEDWIQQILARKLAVIEEVVDGVEGSRNASVTGELLDRIKQELFTRKPK